MNEDGERRAGSFLCIPPRQYAADWQWQGIGVVQQCTQRLPERSSYPALQAQAGALPWPSGCERRRGCAAGLCLVRDHPPSPRHHLLLRHSSHGHGRSPHSSAYPGLRSAVGCPSTRAPRNAVRVSVAASPTPCIGAAHGGARSGMPLTLWRPLGECGEPESLWTWDCGCRGAISGRAQICREKEGSCLFAAEKGRQPNAILSIWESTATVDKGGLCHKAK